MERDELVMISVSKWECMACIVCFFDFGFKADYVNVALRLGVSPNKSWFPEVQQLKKNPRSSE